MSIFGIFHGWQRKRPLLDKLQSEVKDTVLQIYGVLLKEYKVKLDFIQDGSKLTRKDLREALRVEQATIGREGASVDRAILVLGEVIRKKSVATDLANEEQLRNELILLKNELPVLQEIIKEQNESLIEYFNAVDFKALVEEEGRHLMVEHDELDKILAELSVVLAEKPEIMTSQLREKRIAELEKLRFSTARFPEATSLLVANWDLVEKLNAKNESKRDFSSLWPLCMPEIAKRDLLKTRADVKLVIDLNEKTGPYNAKTILQNGLYAVMDFDQSSGFIKTREEIWRAVFLIAEFVEKAEPGLVKRMLSNGLLSVKRAGLIKNFDDLELVVELTRKTKPSQVLLLFDAGLPAVVDAKLIKNRQDLITAADNLIKLMNFCAGAEHYMLKELHNLLPYWAKFGLQIFDILLIPCAKAQGPGTFLCFEQFFLIASWGSTGSVDDLAILNFITTKYPIKAADILKNLVHAGLAAGIVSHQIHEDAEILKSFLRNSPAYLPELYQEYKVLYLQHLPNLDIRAKELFRRARELKEAVVKGDLALDRQNESIGLAVLFHVFSPEITMDREMYKRCIDNRQSRESDIPELLVRRLSGKKASIDVGSVELNEGEELGTSAWADLVEAVEQVNANPVSVDESALGFELLEPNIGEKRKELLVKIYAWWRQQGNSLPSLSSSYDVLVKYKEFVGDRLNDVIFSCLDAAQKADPARFQRKIGQKPIDFSRLAKMLAGLWQSAMPVEQKRQRVTAILQQNGFAVVQLDWQPSWTAVEIAGWLSQYTVIDKSLVARIKEQLYGENYRAMQNEMQKFKFTRARGTKTFTFVLSKKKSHSVAMFNMGVCVAVDDKLWNSPDMWQMIIFDEENNACGGVIYRTISENGKRYLVASIHPSQKILSTVSPKGVYEKIVQFSQLMKKLLKYDELLIPTSPQIHSNRTSMQEQIAAAKYKTRKLDQKYSFSYSPYAYDYQDFYIAT